jgi:hypothetical protein
MRLIEACSNIPQPLQASIKFKVEEPIMQTIKPSTPALIKDLGILFTNDTSKQKRHFGLYKCQCGNEFITLFSSTKNGHTNSCGCYNKSIIKVVSITHGLRYHRIYNTWKNMVARTTSPKKYNFNNYGGRGIIVCARWKNVAYFIEDMYPSYQEGMSIDRINNDGNYEPSNCRWTTKCIQSRNTKIIRPNNTSGYRGVSFDKHRGLWSCQITINSKSKYLGRFNTALDAAKAYDKYVIDNSLEHTINGV